jgi:hypothetical protein
MRRITFFILLCLLSTSVFGLALTGDGLKNTLNFQVGKEFEYKYTFTNAQPYSADYDLFVEKTYGGEFYHFFEIYPEHITGVEPGGSRQFTVKLKFPQDADYPGFSEYRVWVKETIDTGGNIIAVPAVGIRYIMFVLYPYKYLQVGFKPDNINEGEKTEFKIGLHNLGKPIIRSISGNLQVFDISGTKLAELQTNNVLDLQSDQGAALSAKYDSSSLRPGDYKVIADVDWDGNRTHVESGFRVGELKVDIYRFTNEFVKDAINRMDIYVESKWNAKIKSIYAEVFIFNQTRQVATFKSFSGQIEPFEKELLESYFDTTGLNVGNYTAKIIAYYDGKTTEAVGNVEIKQSAQSQVVTEIPKKNSFSLRSLFGSPLLIIIVLVISAAVNIFLLFRKQKKKTIDDEILENVKTLLKTYNKDYLRKTLLSKGWSEEQIKEIFSKIK